MRVNNEYFILFLVSLLNLALLIYSASSLSISFNEAEIFYSNSSFLKEFGFLHEIVKGSDIAFSGILDKDLAIRMPFLLTHFINIFLVYKISKKILANSTQRLIAACVYMYLPGVMASAIIINSAVFIILVALIAIYFVQNSHFKSLLALFVASIFISQAFMALYLALFFYGIYSKNKLLATFGAIFSLAWLFIFDFDFSGKPKGYIIDTMAVFGAAFSPLIFIYFIYTFYRMWIKETKDFSWFVAVSAFCFCLLLSTRAKPSLELFLPFCVIFVPHMIRLFFASYFVRLPKFRFKYKFLAFLMSFTLILNALVSIFPDFLYAFLANPKSHFAYNYSVVKELAAELKKREINEILSDFKLARRLEFYEIKSGGKLFLSEEKCSNESIKIKKFNVKIAEFFICE